MGVIKRFAVWSMVLGALAIAGGASALAFEGTSSATRSESIAPVEVAPAAVADIAPAPVDNTQGWAAPHNISYDPTPID